ncbi:protein indeterminate-domain 11-like isoform X1 [Lycium ferocissimum]|uniref:protein indeterminate-domain 11-like isoform X1 n=1 Tax=Lycium ferocissimum TaxID=112874 RepID=UPI002816700B|nr:protein indeterminate-domain 11-like isoform X1 [Lycium ferocissimum]XP_059299594.1 protein indeterminate-domain 11-like isoform X1 [Lycium ferocissimum]
MSSLTSASGEAASLSSCNMNNDTTGASFYPLQRLITPQNQNPPQQIRKKRNQPGNPDPEAEVIALSPKTLVATNRFFCEICNKGFQRDQNLQLHRRGHNLPWKLKKRENNNEVVRKKVYVCPESNCVHHDPSRALGDLTGIKKHFSRKHGEKKWKCEKCSKRYAVQSDCKAHSKTCGTKEYKCECGTLFSRRDSFITHRAFCDTLAVESARAITGNPTMFPSQMNLQFQQPQYFSNHDQLPPATFSMKKEQPSDNFRHIEIPPWLMTNCQPFAGAGPGPPPPHNFSSSSIFQTTKLDQEYSQSHKDFNLHQNPNPNLGAGPTSTATPYNSTGESAVFSHISATALLQKAGQLGATISNKASAVSANTGPDMLMRQIPHNSHVSVATTKQTDQNLSSREELTTTGPANISGGTGMMTTSFSNFANATTGFEGSTFEDAILFGGFNNLNSKKDDDQYFNRTINEDMTKDFLGLRPLSHNDDIFNIAGLVSTTTPSEHDQFKNHKTWQS